MMKDFIFEMLEKDKSKRAFVIELFKFFPQTYFVIEDSTDKANFDAYSLFKDELDRKRIVDGNKHKIHEQFDVLNKRQKAVV